MISLENSSNTDSNMKIIFSGDEYYQLINDRIAKSQTEVLVEVYIYDFDPIGIRLLQELEKAKSRGVRVRILVDGVGSFNSVSNLTRECQRRGLSFRIYHPIPLELKLISILSWKNLKRILYLFRRINKRNHRKMILIDHKDVFLGSFNISQVHSEKYLTLHSWRDTGAYLELSKDPSNFTTLREAFNLAWRQSRPKLFSTLRSLFRRRQKTLPLHRSLFRINNSRRQRNLIKKELLHKINNAEKQILITNAYFVPRPRILRALIKAAKKGVYVGLCLPGKTDVWFVREASRYLYHRLLKSGVKIFEYKPRILHAKTLVIDHWGTIGSHNFNHRSLLHDLEIEVVIQEPLHIEKLNSQWQLDVSNSKEITLQEISNTHFFRRFMARIIYWFRYWI